MKITEKYLPLLEGAKKYLYDGVQYHRGEVNYICNALETSWMDLPKDDDTVRRIDLTDLQVEIENRMAYIDGMRTEAQLYSKWYRIKTGMNNTGPFIIQQGRHEWLNDMILEAKDLPSVSTIYPIPDRYHAPR